MIHRLISTFIITGLGLLAAAYVVSGFFVNLSDITDFLALVAVITVINVIIRPIIKLVLTPLIILTFGLFNLVINGAILYIVDIYSQNISISGLPALIYGTLIITVITVILGVGSRKA